jgi:SAM-dependent methyltransferase
MFNLKLINDSMNGYLKRSVDKNISPLETMNNEWYFDAGLSAVEIILAALASSWVNKVERVLDLPCGHGRVLRHLVNLFPDAQFDVCDLDVEGCNWCASHFGAKAIHSQADLTKIDFGARYDLIWIGSLFTHTSLEVTKRWMAHLSKFLTPNGIIVATLHGRWSESVGNKYAYIGKESWGHIVRQYQNTGYGYADYNQQENHDYIKGSYGVSLSRPSKIIGLIESIPGIRIYSYTERMWVDHQDVVVFGGPSFNEPW